MRGSITRRGRSSWRLKFDVDTVAGQRQTRYVTVRGKRQDAERELTQLVAAAHDGTLVEPAKVTVAAYLESWLAAPHSLGRKTVERYKELARWQIVPFLGSVVLQKLRPAHIEQWHRELLAAGGKGGRPLAARTVGNAHRVLHRALERAVLAEVVSRNVAHLIKPPAIKDADVVSLRAEQIQTVLEALVGHLLQPIAVLALSTGARRGELLGLAWRHVDLAGGTVTIERALEQADGRLTFKAPKTKHGKRTIALPRVAVDALEPIAVGSLRSGSRRGKASRFRTPWFSAHLRATPFRPRT
jgi:integrase